MSYPLTMQLIREYLKTLGPDQEAGLSASAFQCPVARALKHRYGVEFLVCDTYYHPVARSEEYNETPDNIAELIGALDRGREAHSRVSRSEVEGLLGEDINK